MAFFMYLADSSKRGSINIKNHNYSDSFLIGFFQAFAILPGVSRSGITISSALISGWERGDAAKFSFLLGMPAISLAAIVEFISSFNDFFFIGFLPSFCWSSYYIFVIFISYRFLIKVFFFKWLENFYHLSNNFWCCNSFEFIVEPDKNLFCNCVKVLKNPF